jgi:predicted metalloprotease with PDZ domain
MKKLFFIILFTSLFWNCKTGNSSSHIASKAKNTIQVDVNLIDIKDDRVFVSVKLPKTNTKEVVYHLPKTVPGTYSEDNYGRYIEDFKAFDDNGMLLLVKKTDDNSWSIANARALDKITYWVNDTYDTEKGGGFGKEDIFSPAGSNIDTGKNVMLNTHCFVGYFSHLKTPAYNLTVTHSANFYGATSMIDHDASATKDVFISPNYEVLVENPIMYSKPNFTNFTVNGMEILIAVYSPTGKFTAESITPAMKTMMIAQKTFLGNINTTKKYTVLLYLSTAKNDALGNGALEHPTATTVVFPESISEERLLLAMKDVVSHEFFHILTPLTVHSKEIQYFDFNAPKMSEHLWMYEGVTEYFSHLFQINQGLIDETEFYNRVQEKIDDAKKMNDSMSFTKMSANVLKQPYKDQYLNVYQKGALIGMCMDLIIREKSNGQRGILDLMQKLSGEYGVSKAFDDKELFAKITKLTYPEVGNFLKTYVAGTTPIPYSFYLAKVGVGSFIKKVPSYILEKDGKQYIAKTYKEHEIIINSDRPLNVFFTHLGLQPNDIILAVNDKYYTPEKVDEILVDCKDWKENDSITVKIKRDTIEQTINGTVQLPQEDVEELKVLDPSKSKLKEAWLKG